MNGRYRGKFEYLARIDDNGKPAPNPSQWTKRFRQPCADPRELTFTSGISDLRNAAKEVKFLSFAARSTSPNPLSSGIGEGKKVLFIGI
jgi:hypothetical protein